MTLTKYCATIRDTPVDQVDAKGDELVARMLTRPLPGLGHQDSDTLAGSGRTLDSDPEACPAV
jgi:hypothetical protein